MRLAAASIHWGRIKSSSKGREAHLYVTFPMAHQRPVSVTKESFDQTGGSRSEVTGGIVLDGQKILVGAISRTEHNCELAVGCSENHRIG